MCHCRTVPPPAIILFRGKTLIPGEEDERVKVWLGCRGGEVCETGVAGMKSRDSLNIVENSLKDKLFECRKNNWLQRGRHVFTIDDWDISLEVNSRTRKTTDIRSDV